MRVGHAGPCGGRCPIPGGLPLPSPVGQGGASWAWAAIRSAEARSRVAEAVMTLGMSWSAIRSRKSTEVRFLLPGQDAVAAWRAGRLGPSRPRLLGRCRPRWRGPGCRDGPEGATQGGLVEPGGAGGLGGQLGHLLDARSVEVTALAVLPAQESRVLVAVSAGTQC